MNDLSTIKDLPKSILVLCPHPDDFDIAAVTLRHFKENSAEITAYIAPTWSGILDSFYDQKVSNEQKIQTRVEEQRQSLNFFGLESSKIHFFPNTMDLDQNGEMTDSQANYELIENAILSSKPDAIFIPHYNDPNPAHSAMYKTVKEVVIKQELQLDLYLQMDPKTKGIEANAYTPISVEAEKWKRQLLNHHKTQSHRNFETRGIDFAERILSTNKAAAEKLKLEQQYAEVFEIMPSSSLLAQ